MASYRFSINKMYKAIWNGDFKHAKRLIQYKARTLPEVQAYRLGRAIGALVDPDSSVHDPDAAVRLLEEFRPK